VLYSPGGPPAHLSRQSHDRDIPGGCFYVMRPPQDSRTHKSSMGIVPTSTGLATVGAHADAVVGLDAIDFSAGM
jgi:hypothetical protein